MVARMRHANSIIGCCLVCALWAVLNVEFCNRTSPRPSGLAGVLKEYDIEEMFAVLPPKVGPNGCFGVPAS